MFTSHALTYAELNWPVFPLRPNTSEFFGKLDDAEATAASGGYGGFHWATTDRAKLAEWGDRWPDANIAVRTGAKSGLVVLDMDFGKPGSNTAEAVERLAQRGFLFPKPNVISTTPSGGKHWFYRYVGPLGSSASRLGRDLMGEKKSHIDIRADGGLATLPPTVAAGRGNYTWDLPPWDDDGRAKRLVPVPRWVMDQLQSQPPPIRPYTPPQRTNAGDIPEWRLQKLASMGPETGRNAELFKQASQARDWGHSEIEIERKFLDAATASGLERSKALATIRQALLEKNRRDTRRA